MTEIHETITPTIQAIYDHYVTSAPQKNLRNHLGASRIGNACQREIWYEFRHVYYPEVVKDGRMLRMFETGNLEEDRIAKNFRDISVTVKAKDDSGRQFSYQEPDNKFFSGSVDGFGIGFLEDEIHDKWVVIEYKTMNTATFKLLRNKGVKIVKPEHYDQMQTYMRWSKLDYAFYAVKCKETDDLYGEIIKLDPEYSLVLRELAHGIVTSAEPPAPIGSTPDFYKCKYCDAKPFCHGYGIPLINCRTCALSSPNLITGKFDCDVYHSECPELTECDCPRHVLLPALIKAPVNDADEEEHTISYMVAGKKVINGYNHTKTSEMLEMYKKWMEIR